MLISALNTTTVVASSNIDDEGDASNQEQDPEENTNTQSRKQKFLAFLKDWQVIPSALLGGILIRSLIVDQAEVQKKSKAEDEARSSAQNHLKSIMIQCSRFNSDLQSELEYDEDAKTIVPEVFTLLTNHKAKTAAAKGEAKEIKIDDINKAFQKDVINWLKKHEKILFQKDLAFQAASFDKFQKAETEYIKAINNANKIARFAPREQEVTHHEDHPHRHELPPHGMPSHPYGSPQGQHYQQQVHEFQDQGQHYQEQGHHPFPGRSLFPNAQY